MCAYQAGDPGATLGATPVNKTPAFSRFFFLLGLVAAAIPLTISFMDRAGHTFNIPLAMDRALVILLVIGSGIVGWTIDPVIDSFRRKA